MLIEQIKAILAKLEHNMIQPGNRQFFRGETPQKRVLSIDRQNHSQGESKIRRKLAAASNRINRKRVKHWRH